MATAGPAGVSHICALHSPVTDTCACMLHVHTHRARKHARGQTRDQSSMLPVCLLHLTPDQPSQFIAHVQGRLSKEERKKGKHQLTGLLLLAVVVPCGFGLVGPSGLLTICSLTTGVYFLRGQ